MREYSATLIWKIGCHLRKVIGAGLYHLGSVNFAHDGDNFAFWTTSGDRYSSLHTLRAGCWESLEDALVLEIALILAGVHRYTETLPLLRRIKGAPHTQTLEKMIAWEENDHAKTMAPIRASMLKKK